MKNLPLAIFFFISLPALSQHENFTEKKITIMLSDVSLERALTILEASYNIEFSYSDDVVPVDTAVALAIKDEIITVALKKLLEPFNITYKISGRRIILKRLAEILTQTIRGRITDEMDGPIIGCVVIIHRGDQTFRSITDEKGKYKVSNIPVGRINLVASSLGYNSKDFNNILVSTGKELVHDISLTASVTTMDEVIITGLRNEGIPGNGMAVTSAHSFTAEDTKRFAGSVGDASRMASAFAGVTGASDESNALIVRGNSPRGVLWRVDGIEIPNPNHFATEGASSGVVNVLSPNVIERSEFLTGSFPALYGNALSAVFDINLRNGNNEHNEYSFQAGLLGLETSVEGPFNKHHTSSSYLINYRYSTLSILSKLGADLNEANQYRDYQDLFIKTYFPSARYGTFSLFGIGGTSQSSKYNPDVNDNNSADMGVIGLTHELRLNENTAIQSALSTSGTHISKDYIKGVEPEILQYNEQYSKWYARMAFSIRRKISGKYFLEGGFIHSWLNYDFFLRSLDPQNTAYQEITIFRERSGGEYKRPTIMQGFLYARQYITPSLSAFYGTHFLRFSLTHDSSIEPRIGIRWQIINGHTVSFAYGKHGRIENLQYYLARDHQPGGDEVQINRNLKFTRSNHITASYEHLFSNNHKLKLEAYHQRLYDAPVEANSSSFYSAINEDTGFITDTLLNNGNGRNYGTEVTFERSFFNNFYYIINGSVYQSVFNIKGYEVKNTSYNGNYSIHIIGGKEFVINNGHNCFVLNIKITSAGGRRYIPIDLKKSIESNSQVYDYERAFERQLPDYFRGDLQLMYKHEYSRHSVEWRLDIQNLTDHRNASSYYYNTEKKLVALRKQVGIIPLLSCRIEFRK